MVDAIVSFAVEKLGNFLIQEVALRKSLRENVQWLRNELLFMQSFLKHAEVKQVEDHRVQQWIFEINSVANDAVSILETYSFAAGDQGGNHGFASRLKGCACVCKKETQFYNIGKEIQSLKQRVMDISRKRETYGIRNIDNVAGEGPSNRPNNIQRSALRRTTSSVDDQDRIFVGFQEVVETLLAELLKEESCRSIISIYGMGGSGKTSLARNLYNSPSLVTSFSTRAWICVSQEYSIPDLLQSVIKSIQSCNKETLDLLEKMTERDLETHLRNILKEQKYLVVVDDVWTREAWESLKRAFPDSKNGSRVIITTRKEDVAKRADDKGFVHKLRFLSPEESWDLFCKKLLDVQAMIPTMENLARDMVGKCAGLPLAIVVLSGLLSYKLGLEEWQKVKVHLWRNMKDDSFKISDILSLSYNDLPTELKQCFLYFGIYPEDHMIPAESIMWMWMAEGLIPIRGEERMEDIAKDILNELIRRNLIQVADTFWEEVTKCRIHDLLRDLAVQKSLEVNFLDIYNPREHSISSLCFRHVIHDQPQRYLSLDFSNLNLRSVIFFSLEYPSQLEQIKFHKMFQHLYVLHLANTWGTRIPHSIGSLYHLKYLSLTRHCRIPSSIGILKNLQTLQIMDTDTECYTLPPQITNLPNLRHLVARYTVPLQHINKLTSLIVLRNIHCDQWKDVDPVDLVNLQELSMYGIRVSYNLNNISSLKSVSILRLSCYNSESFPALEFLSSCQNLQKLRLDFRIRKLPPFPNSITMMVLWSSLLQEDPMSSLGMLPNLRHLDLENAYCGGEITCNENTFCQLEFLRLQRFSELERWNLAPSAMPRIKGLGIYDCEKLKEIPLRMKGVAILERLKLYDDTLFFG